MSETDISDFEDAISEAKDAFYSELNEMLKLLRIIDIELTQIQDKFNEVHRKGVAYFNLFDRSLSEYGLEKYDMNINIRDSKIDDAINISYSIINYWELIIKLNAKYGINIPKASKRAFSTIQIYIKTFEPKAAEPLKEKFQEVGLPVSGFESKRKFKDMTKKKQVTFGMIAGTVLLIVLIVYAWIEECPTDFQGRIFTTILALAAAAFSAAIPGLINVKYRGMITASGAIAVFVIVFLLKPAELSDFAYCQKDISGTIYFGHKPQALVKLKLLKQSQVITTDEFGNFRLPIDYTTIDKELKIYLTSSEIYLDTVYSIQKSVINESLDIYLPKYCFTCTQKDSSGELKDRKQVCGATRECISKYIHGYRLDGIELGLVVECDDN